MAIDSALVPSVSLINTLLETVSSTVAESEMVKKNRYEIESSTVAESYVDKILFVNILSAVVIDSALVPSVSLMNTLLEIVSSTVAESEMV